MILFENGLGKGTKSALYKAFVPTQNKFSGKVQYIIDGGFLLHKVVWPENQSFSAICNRYVDYVINIYGPQTVVVFDGYPEGTKGGTKSAERLKRSMKTISADILFDENMIPTIKKEKFLANTNNKRRLISMIIAKLHS